MFSVTKETTRRVQSFHLPIASRALRSGSTEMRINPMNGSSIWRIRKIAAETEKLQITNAVTVAKFSGAKSPNPAKSTTSQKTRITRNANGMEVVVRKNT